MQIDIRHNIDVVVKRLQSNRTDQIPFATSVALNKSVEIAKTKLVAYAARVFDRPTPYTLNAFQTKWSTKRNLVASIKIKDETYKGTPADRYLRPQIEGGGRNLKRFERALQAAGILPAGMYVVPASAAPLDAYGNVPAQFYIRVLADLRAFGEQGYRANRKGGRRKGRAANNAFFVPPRHGGSHLKPAIYWRLQNRFVVPVFAFTRAPNYPKRFAFYEFTRNVAVAAFDEQFRLAWQQALKTAR